MNKIFFDSDGNIGIVQSENIIDIRDNELAICDSEYAKAHDIPNEKWITLEQLRCLPNPYAELAYERLKNA